MDKRTCPPHLKVYIEAFTGLGHGDCVHVLNTTSLSQGYVLEAASGNRKGKWNPHSKDRRRDEETLVIWVQFMGQPVVMSSW